MFWCQVQIFFYFVDDGVFICVYVEMIECKFEIGDVRFYFQVEYFVCYDEVVEYNLF